MLTKNKFPVDLSEFKLFSTMTEENRKKVKQLLFRRTFKKNQLLFSEGDPRDRIYLLNKGYIKLEKTNKEETMLYINFIKPNDIFPYVGLFTEEYYRYSAYALTDIDLYYISTSKFESFIKDKNSTLLYLVKHMDLLTKRHQDRLQTVTTSLASDRVEQSISYLINNFSIEQENGYYVDIPLTMVELAKIAGTTRETVSNVIRTLESKGIITRDGRHIIANDKNYFLDKSL